MWLIILPKGGINMIDMEQKVKIKWGRRNQKYYTNLGYEPVPYGEYIDVKLSDITLSTVTQVEAVCDYCGEKYYPLYRNYCIRKEKTNGKDCCNNCKTVKLIEKQNEIKHNNANRMFNKLQKIMNENNYKLLTSVEEYDGIYMEIKYICPIHGQQTQSLNEILNGNHLCRFCGYERMKSSHRKTVEEIENIINSIDGNLLLNPNDYTRCDKRNLWIRCSCGNKYYTSLRSFIRGKTRCDECTESESRGEYTVRKWLEEHNINFIPQYVFDDCRDTFPLPFDFYLPYYNMCLEYDGEQHEYPHFGKLNFESTIYHDGIKNQYCKDNDINLLRISYRNFNNIDEILTKELLTI